MAKDENIVQTLLKVSRKSDKNERLMFEVLSKCEKKTDLIKNALFNYIVNIQNGKIIDRAYPYTELERFIQIENDKEVCDCNSKDGDSITDDSVGNIGQEEDKNYNQNDNSQDDSSYKDNDYDDDEDDHEDDYEDENLDIPF